MQRIGFYEALEQILREDERYARDAYAFLRDALESTLKHRNKGRRESSGHVTAKELLEGFRLHALQECGPMATTVLGYWGVHSCQDIGNIVFNLVEAGVFGKTDDDSPEAFADGYDFDEAFDRPFRPAPSLLSKSGVGVVGSPE